MKNSVIPYDSFVPLLLERVPELLGVYHEHLGRNDELLPHVFLGDVCRFFADLYVSKNQDISISFRIIKTMDEGYKRGDEETQELVCVSFLENIAHDHDDVYHKIKSDLTPALRRAVKDYE